MKIPEQLKIPRVEKIFIWLFIIGYAMITNLPRIIMFVQGGQLMESAPLDEPWHIAELVSVARTGIPPRHYLFPDLKLIYYYSAWIYPAIIGNSTIVQISLIRAMAIHVFMITFSFLAVINYLIYSNIRSSLIRIAGILMFTLMGGFDLFIKLPGIEFIDWWPLVSRWIVSNLQISQFTTLYVWVPHHVAAAMSFGVLLLLWRNIDAALMTKAAFSGLLLGFCFITSPFVFLFSIFALGLLLLFNATVLIKNWKQIAPPLIIAVVVFVMGVWYSVILYMQQNNGGFGFRDFYLNVFETLRGGSGISLLIDRVITVLGFPLIAIWIGLIELGLAFILYVAWMIKEFVFSSAPNRKPIFIVLALFPLISMFLIFFIEDRGGGDNFGMRGFIPAQMCIIFAGLLFLDEIGQKNKLSRWQILSLIYIFGCLLIAQSFSSFAEIRAHSVRPIKVVLSQNLPKKLSIGEEISPNWPVNYDYIH